MRCGLAFLAAGMCREAARFLERALRYRPDDEKASVGLARCFVSIGQPMRAITLLERAAASAESSGQSDPHAQLLLACLLAKETADLPQAIARVRQISSECDVAVEARLWEARWRRNLGDLVGASVAWARMRELVELGKVTDSASEWLVEAAIYERDIRDELIAAERHLAIALRLSPQDKRVSSLYREIAAKVANTAKTSPL